MPSLWTDNDAGGHPWLAAPPRGVAGPPPDPQDDAPPASGFARPAVMTAACTAAVLAGAAIELLR